MSLNEKIMKKKQGKKYVWVLFTSDIFVDVFSTKRKAELRAYNMRLDMQEVSVIRYEVK